MVKSHIETPDKFDFRKKSSRFEKNCDFCDFYLLFWVVLGSLRILKDPQEFCKYHKIFQKTLEKPKFRGNPTYRTNVT